MNPSIKSQEGAKRIKVFKDWINSGVVVVWVMESFKQDVNLTL